MWHEGAHCWGSVVYQILAGTAIAIWFAAGFGFDGDYGGVGEDVGEAAAAKWCGN